LGNQIEKKITVEETQSIAVAKDSFRRSGERQELILSFETLGRCEENPALSKGNAAFSDRFSGPTIPL
jgi:hypothetical protein